MADKVAVLSATAGKPIKCRAAVARKAGEALVIEEVMVAPPNRLEVRIRIICSALCHTDVTFWKMTEPPACFPRIFGHESVGVVESVGEGVDKLTPGDMVLPLFLPECGDCKDCRSEKSNLCSKFPFQISATMLRDGTSRFTDLHGQILHHFFWVSSFSEYTVVDEANVIRIQDSTSIPPRIACLLSCGVPTGVGAAWRAAKVEKGSTVAIFGLGPVGLGVAEGARFCGAKRIIGVDINPDKFEIAKKFGVTEFINSNSCGDKPVSMVINEMTEGGADYCFECVGKTSVVQEAYACCRKAWGKTIMMGADENPQSQLNFNSYDVLLSGKTLRGTIYGDLKPKSDIPILINHYMNQELELDKFVSHEVDFEEINKAFELLLQGKCIRCIIWMDQTKRT